jgi:hypothetical protein
VHILRHSAAKLRRDAGESVEEVSRFLEHSSLATTTVVAPRCRLVALGAGLTLRRLGHPGVSVAGDDIGQAPATRVSDLRSQVLSPAQEFRPGSVHAGAEAQRAPDGRSRTLAPPDGATGR